MRTVVSVHQNHQGSFLVRVNTPAQTRSSEPVVFASDSNAEGALLIRPEGASIRPQQPEREIETLSYSTSQLEACGAQK